MADTKIKHFVIIRFFPKQFVNYPFDIFDVNFLSKQIILAKNALTSLDNQTNKNFEIVFLANKKFFSDAKYEFIFSTLKASTKLPVRFIKTPGKAWMYARSELPAILKAAFEEYDYVIQTRMDFDDFVNKNVVADTQDKVSKCENVLLYGYCKGYRYILGELFKMDYLHEEGHQGLFQSLILKSSFAKDLPFFSVYSFSHDSIKLDMKKFLKKKASHFPKICSCKTFLTGSTFTSLIISLTTC